MPSGRFAPTPSGPLHVGNLRTALVAWLFARTDASPLWLRFDDLDAEAVRPEHYRSQADDLAALGLGWDGEPVRQSERLPRYRAALAELEAAGVVYPCFCSRREIREAAQAPNSPLSGHGYPGTCRDLAPAERARRRAAGRTPALRLRAEGAVITFDDRLAGPQRHRLDDFVVMRNDGTPAYHLVNVVDDHEMGIDLVVRGDDLLPSAARQLFLARLLERPEPAQAHVPLVLSPGGERLAKRHGAVGLADRAARGEAPERVLSFLAASLGLAEPGEPVTPDQLVARFDPAALPREPFVLAAAWLAAPE
ncbi:MAG: tRNA glutamyl-Q(34) synthetase GluQRS [Acidimicrobiales bacterium]